MIPVIALNLDLNLDSSLDLSLDPNLAHSLSSSCLLSLPRNLALAPDKTGTAEIYTMGIKRFDKDVQC